MYSPAPAPANAPAPKIEVKDMSCQNNVALARTDLNKPESC